MANEIYSGVDAVLKACATTDPPGTPGEIEHFRSFEIDEKADVDNKPDSSTDGWDAAIGGNKEWDATLAIHIPYSGNLTGGISGNVTDLNGTELAHVRKVTMNYANSVSKAASSDTGGWKVTTKGTNSYRVSIDCYADEATFAHGDMKAGETVSIIVEVNTGIPVLTGNVTIERFGGFKAGVEGGNIGFTIEGRGHLSVSLPTITPFELGELFDFELYPIGGESPIITGTARMSSLDDFTIDVEGITFVGGSMKFAGHGELVRFEEI